MDRDTEAYKLATEGINGLRLVPRDSIPFERQRKIKADLIGAQGDRRYEKLVGVYKPTKDYMIFGEGRPPLIVREVQSEIKGMKKYALVDMRDVYDVEQKGMIQKAVGKLGKGLFGKKDEIPYVEVGFAYSEGIDVEKMIGDPTYASTVISLFQEGRLSELRGETDTCYIGTIEKTDEGYSKMIRPNPQEVMKSIKKMIKEQEEAQRQERDDRRNSESKRAGRKRNIEDAVTLAKSLTSEQMEVLMELYMKKVGKDEFKKMLASIVSRDNAGTTLIEQLTEEGEYEPDDYDEQDI